MHCRLSGYMPEGKGEGAGEDESERVRVELGPRAGSWAMLVGVGQG